MQKCCRMYKNLSGTCPEKSIPETEEGWGDLKVEHNEFQNIKTIGGGLIYNIGMSAMHVVNILPFLQCENILTWNYKKKTSTGTTGGGI